MSEALAVQNGAVVEIKTEQPVSLMSFALQMAASGTDADKLEKIMALLERQESQTRKDNFFNALARVQKLALRVKKSGMMDRGPGKGQIPYAKLEDIDAMMRPIYQAEGFTVTWDYPRNDSLIRVVGSFTACGHTETREWSCSPDTSGGKQNPQAAGSTDAYGQRYLSKAFWNIIEDGADTNGATPDEVQPITQGQADDIRTRMNDLPQRTPGGLLAALCRKHGVQKAEELRASQLNDVIADVVATERQKR